MDTHKHRHVHRLTYPNTYTMHKHRCMPIHMCMYTVHVYSYTDIYTQAHAHRHVYIDMHRHMYRVKKSRKSILGGLSREPE